MCDLIGCADSGPGTGRLCREAFESCEWNVRWLPSVYAYLSQPHMNMCGRPRICIRGWYD